MNTLRYEPITQNIIVCSRAIKFWPFTTQEDENKEEQEKEGVKGEEKAEPYSVKEQTHKELEELQTQQPAEVQMNTCIKFVIFSLLGCSCA